MSSELTAISAGLLRLILMLLGTAIFSQKKPEWTMPWLIAWALNFLILVLFK